jgi:hypothetical protein
MDSTGISSDRDDNVSKICILTYLHTYLHNNKNNKNNTDRYHLTTSISKSVYRDFALTCRQLGLIHRNDVNITLEGLMKFIVENFRNQPQIQQTITNFIGSITVNKQVNVGQRVEAVQSNQDKIQAFLTNRYKARLRRLLGKMWPNQELWESTVADVLQLIRRHVKDPDEEMGSLIEEALKRLQETEGRPQT